MDKNRVKISEVLLNRPPFTLKKFNPTNVNFFFGKNGTGKSTIARSIDENTGLSWVPGSSMSTTIQVFNDQYIKRNIDGKLDGVFTISEADIKTETEIKETSEKLETEKGKIKKHREEMDQCKVDITNENSSAYDLCWNATRSLIKKFQHNPTNAGSKEMFYKQITSVTPHEHSVEELLQLEKLVYDNTLKPITELSPFRIPAIDLSILSTSIVALEKTQFSEFMKAMGDKAVDWVYKGHSEFEKLADGVCPYCQQPLTDKIKSDLQTAFDESYTEALNQLKELKNIFAVAYKQKFIEAANFLKSCDGFRFIKDAFTPLELQAQICLETIEKRLKEKEENPSAIIETPLLLDSIIEEINALIEKANTEIKKHNAQIAADNKKGDFEKAVREHCAFLCISYVENHIKNIEKITTRFTKAKGALEESEKNHDDYVELLSLLHKKTTSTVPVIDQINNLLAASGFESFKIAPEDERNYKLVRPDNSEAKNLSEGEKNFICFLYFYYSVFGVLDEERGLDDRIVVIDDPVSSMDSDAIFIIAELIRNIIEAALNAFNPVKEDGVATHIKQVFILTHNAFFYNEVAPMYIDNYETVSYFEIIKEGVNSEVVLNTKKINEGAINERVVNFIPDLGNYASLWEIYRTTDNPRILMNTMRRILEEYFLHNLGYTSGSLKKLLLKVGRANFTDNTDFTLARALVNYVSNDAISSINFTTYTNDISKLKAVFHKIFEILGQTEHYEMMEKR